MLVWLACEKQDILTSQPCLHTLMQTRFSANQSVRTVLVILFKKTILITQLPVVYRRPFASKAVFWAILKDFEFGVYCS